MYGETKQHDRITCMTETTLRFTAALPPEIQGNRWEVIFVKEGEFQDQNYNITREALQAAHDTKLFDGVYVQELEFKDGTTRHLPKDIAASGAASGGVFGNVIGITADTVLKVLDDGKTAIVGFIDAIDDKWKTKMRLLAEKGRRLPGLSFNALIPKTSLTERFLENGKRILDVAGFQSCDSFECVSYPNAGGAFLHAVAGQEEPGILAEESPQPLINPHPDRTVFMFEELSRYLTMRGIPMIETDDPVKLVQAAMQTEEYKALRPTEQRLIQSLETVESDVAARLVASLIDIASEPDPKPEPDSEPEVTPEPEKQATTPEPAPETVQADAPNMAGFDAMMEQKMQGYMKEFSGFMATEQQKLEDQRRLQAGENMIQGSALPESFKILALQQFQAVKKDPTGIIKGFTKAVAPFEEEGRVRASVDPHSIYIGPNAKDKKIAGLELMLGAKPRDDDEKRLYAGVRPFRGLQEALGELTGIWAGRLSINEFNDAYSKPERVTADINMFVPSDFPNLMGNTMNRVLVDLYGDEEQTWRQLCTVRKGCKDFRSLRINRLAGFSSPLPVYTDTKVGVSDRYEGGIQLIGVPSEQELSYRPYIRASQFALSYETVVDDDISALVWWLRDFSQASDQTALWLCCQQIINASSGGVINAGTLDYDSTALYHANHSNILTDPLSYDSVRKACSLIRKQRRIGTGGRPLHLHPSILITPESLNDEGDVILNTPGVPATSVHDKNTLGGKIQQITLDEYWLGDHADSERNWYLMADTRNAAVEMAFLFDQEVPQILTANNPTEGLQFTHLRTVFSGIYILGAKSRGHEMIVGSFPTT